MVKHALAAGLAATIIVALAPLTGCAWIDKVDPPLSETPSKDYPCGKQGVVCYEQNASGALAATGSCCDHGEACGGSFPNVGCPAGQCCYEGTDNGLDGARKPHAQRPATSSVSR